jgi:rubrerythrin
MGYSKASQPAVADIQVEDGEEFSRADVILKGALAACALYGLGAVSPYVRGALAADGAKDVDVLNFLLPFEYLLVSIYNRGLSEINDHGEKLPLKKPEKGLLETLRQEEGEHVSALKEMIEDLGGKPVKKGNYAFAFREYDTLLELSSRIETTTIGAYNGAIPTLESDEARTLAFSIVQVEGRHVAKLLVLRKEDPAPEAFDAGESEINSINGVLPFTGIPGIPEGIAE